MHAGKRSYLAPPNDQTWYERIKTSLEMGVVAFLQCGVTHETLSADQLVDLV